MILWDAISVEYIIMEIEKKNLLTKNYKKGGSERYGHVRNY